MTDFDYRPEQDWLPTCNLRYSSRNRLQQMWERVVVKWKIPAGGVRELRYQHTEREWRDVPKSAEKVRKRR